MSALTEEQVEKMMDASSAVLQGMLLNHDKATDQISFLDDYIKGVTSKAVEAMKMGNKGKALQLLKRRCVADGIKHMYRQYRQIKWCQVQKLIISVVYSMNSVAALPHMRPFDHALGSEQEQIEKFAQTMMVAQCNFCRTD